jgi:hypothetical protein
MNTWLRAAELASGNQLRSHLPESTLPTAVSRGDTVSAVLTLRVLQGHKNSIPSAFSRVSEAMVTRCANPSCEAKFKYLHEGRLFHFASNEVTVGPAGSRWFAPVRYWWLCPRCRSSMTLIERCRSGVVLVPSRTVNQDTSRESLDYMGAPL